MDFDRIKSDGQEEGEWTQTVIRIKMIESNDKGRKERKSRSE